MELDPERLKETRLRRMLTQQELADRAGSTEATVNRLENGLQRPRISTVRRLAKALDVAPEELIDWETTEGKVATESEPGRDGSPPPGGVSVG